MRFPLLIAPAVLALGGCAGSADQTAPTPSAAVDIVTARSGQIIRDLVVYGDITADASSRQDFVAPVEARIARIAAPLGSVVSRGQPVIYLSPSPQGSLDLAQAKTSASQANAALERARRLRADGLMSDADVEAAQASARTASALLKSLQTRGYVLRASASGTISQVNYSVGGIVPAGTTIAALTIDGDVRARFGIDPALARLVHRGDPITVTPTSGGQPIASSVIAVDPVVDPVSRLASVYARVPAQAEIAPGEPLKGAITVATHDNALTVPHEALLDDGGQKYVFTVVKGKAKRVDVSTGAGTNGQVAIMTGLNVGDQVVTNGAAGVSDGMAVTQSRPASSASAKPAGVSKK